MRISVFNVKHSQNLGDGLLAECLEDELRAQDPVDQIVSIDLAGRESYGEGSSNRRLALLVLERLPLWLRNCVTRLILSRLVRRKLRPRWRAALKDCDAIIVGGGNLFSDADLNFPMKIHGALQEAAARGIPVAVFSVGVSDHWSTEGRGLFLEGLHGVTLVSASVRDQRSAATWDHLLARDGIVPATVTCDPGLLASRHFPPVPRPSGSRRVALGLTAPVALRYHANDGAILDTLGDWTRELVSALVQRGYEIALFTNGSSEDRDYLHMIGPGLVALSPERVHTEPDFHEPGDMARFVSTQDLVLAHRLHACIAAYSYGVPTIGFTWDVKLRSFFEITDRVEALVDPSTTSAAAVADLAEQAISRGVDSARREALITQTQADVATVARQLRAAVERTG